MTYLNRQCRRIFPAEITTMLFLALLAGILIAPPPAEAIRLKDIATIEGVRNNQLVGYGLVIGLDGTGDGNQAAFTSHGLRNMLENLGVHLGQVNLNVKNVAGVLVTAKLPAFAKSGQNLDVTISSLGDATSLQGGTLIATPLKGLDGKVYAIAQGAMSIGGFEVAGAGTAGVQKNHLLVARIPGGATVEREVPMSFSNKETVSLNLKRQDFTTISRTVAVIDSFLGGTYARAKDGATVVINIPAEYENNEIGFLAAIENLEVMPDSVARVVLDERTGTVVMGENVRINQIALSHGNLSIQVKVEQTPQEEAQTAAAGNENITARQKEHRLVSVDRGVTLGEVIRALNSIGVTPKDLIAIFQSIKAAGALQAELEII